MIKLNIEFEAIT